MLMCDLFLVLQKIAYYMVWKFCEIWKSYGNGVQKSQNSVRFGMYRRDRRKSFSVVLRSTLLVFIRKSVFSLCFLRTLAKSLVWPNTKSPNVTGLRLLATNCERHLWESFQNISKRSRELGVYFLAWVSGICASVAWNLNMLRDQLSLRMVTESSRWCLEPLWNPFCFSFHWSDSGRNMTQRCNFSIYPA